MKMRYIIFGVAAVLLLTTVIVYMQGQSTLSEYQSGTDITSPTTTTTATKYEMTTIVNDEWRYQLDIPINWTAIKKDGYDTFVHSPSETTLQIQTGAYSPQLIAVTEESLSQELEAIDMSILSFSRISNSAYAVAYEGATNGTDYIYAEITHYDKSQRVRAVFTVKKGYWTRMEPVISAIEQSFTFDPASPIPSDVFLLYDSTLNVQFALPSTWDVVQESNVYYASDPDTGSIISIACIPSQNNFSSFSKIDYTSFASASRSNFILQSYAADANQISAIATFVSGNQNMYLRQYIVATGQYEFTITAEYAAAHYDTVAQTIENAIECFAIF